MKFRGCFTLRLAFVSLAVAGTGFARAADLAPCAAVAAALGATPPRMSCGIHHGVPGDRAPTRDGSLPSDTTQRHAPVAPDTIPDSLAIRGFPWRDSLQRDSTRRDSLQRARQQALARTLRGHDSIPREPLRPRAPVDSTEPGLNLKLGKDTTPVRLQTLESNVTYRQAEAEIAAARATALQLNSRSILESTWGQIAAQTFASGKPAPVFPGDVTVKKPREPSKAAQLFNDYADLGVQFDGRLEMRGEKSASNRCQTISVFIANAGCRSVFEPLVDFQYAVRSQGVVADRLHVNVDYDSQREFDASNTISLAYEGTRSEFIQHFELGNVTFQPPPSRFITAAIPSGNYGAQAVMKLGDMRLRTILAQQKGNVVRDRVFTIGDKTLQAVDRTVDDDQFEPRRFFFTVDPSRFAGYPNIDILNHQQMMALSRALPDTLRPVKLYVYRLLIGGQPPNPNGPQFRLNGDPRSRPGQVYEFLREGIDYYVDPSLLWISLVRPLSLNNERLVVAYRVRINGVETTHASTGGTPDVEFTTQHDQYANLLWDPTVKPGDPVFNREIRSVYRVGGRDVLRQSLAVKIVAGSAGDQEKPPGSPNSTYLGLFGLAQSTNPSTFDVDNRLWPRPTDPNFAFGVGAFGQQTIRDQFLVFPSVRPFAANGLAGQANPHNDTIYTTPAEYVNTSLRPPAVYHIRLNYQGEGNGAEGTLLLGSVQVRPNSERILVDNILLTRGSDYSVDYDLGRVIFARPDTLFPRPRQVVVQFEENPLFAETPTSIFGASLEIPLQNGQLDFIALSQSQRTTFTRPALGFEPQATLIGGVNALMNFDADKLSNWVSRLPSATAGAPSHISVSAEFAASKPQPSKGQQAYLESFEGQGGISVSLDDQSWEYSSQPAAGRTLLGQIGGASLDLTRASTMAWQSNVTDLTTGLQLRFSIDQIDPQATLVGAGIAPPEQIMWMSLYPLAVGGLREHDGSYNWQTGVTLTGRRWRSIRTPLGSGAGIDVSRSENLEFWALIHTSGADRLKNPTLVFDVGDISENTVAYSPDSVVIRNRAQGRDTLFFGKKLQGYDQLDSERDPFSRTFNAAVNDLGLPGDVALNIVVTADTLSGFPATTHLVPRFGTCRAGLGRFYPLGDSRANCTIGNGKLDEEDLNGDNSLNYTSAERNQEQWQRYVVDLTDQQKYTRVGKCVPAALLDPAASPADSACWVYFRVPFRSPSDTLNNPSLRRALALRVTMVSALGAADGDFTRIALDRLQFTGAPWFKRSDAAIPGLSGEQGTDGFVILGTIGTQDKNVRSGVDYESPPGVTDAPDSKLTPVSASRVQINEHSLRMMAGGLQQYDRAEAYLRFPEGQKNFMGYKQLRVWARGVGNGWGTNGELQFFMKIGRDASNFYMYRTPLTGGSGEAAWLPEIVMDFSRFITLRGEIQNAYLKGTRRNTCTGDDSVLIAHTPLPPNVAANAIYAACDSGYIVYTVDPSVSAPNLAAVQELAVGMMRTQVGTGSRPIAPADTLELWVDDIRLGGVVDAAGFAGQVGVGIVAGDFADIRANVSRRDPNFRQLGDQPTYQTDNTFDFTAAFHLEKLLPKSFGYALPMTVTYSDESSTPTYLTDSDLSGDAVPGLRTPRVSATSVTFGIHRATPVAGVWWAPIINNLSLNSSYTDGNTRTEYQDGRAYDFRVGLDYNLINAIAPNTAAWLPAEFVLSSTYERGSDRRLSYLKPAYASDDIPSIVGGETNTWRQGGAISFHPVPNSTIRLNLTSTRDLRNYGDETVIGMVNTGEQSHVAGVNLGAERERDAGTQLSYNPIFTPWLRGRFSSSSDFSMVRDPNALDLLQAGDTTGMLTIPRRLANTQTSIAGLTLDLPALARQPEVPTPVRGIFRMLQPIDMAIERNVLTAYDGSAANPSLGYQFGLGGIGAFRHIGGEQATSAGVSTQVTLSQNIVLPLGLIITNRYQRVTLRNWTQQLDSVQAIGDGTQRNFPDIGLRWNLQFAPRSPLLRSLTMSARLVGTDQLISSPGFIDSTGNDGETRMRSYPMSFTAVWAGARPLTTTFSATITQRLDNRPGVSGRGNGLDFNADVARAFALPEDWHARSDLRTRISYQNSSGESYVLNPLAIGGRSTLTDNGRRALSLTADTDVAENLSSSFIISRVSTFDNNFDRQFTQTVLSAVLHLQFYAGDMK